MKQLKVRGLNFHGIKSVVGLGLVLTGTSSDNGAENR